MFASFGDSVSASLCVGACVFGADVFFLYISLCVFLCLCLRLIDLCFGEMQMHDIFQLTPAKIQVGVFFSTTMPPEALEIICSPICLCLSVSVGVGVFVLSLSLY